MCGVSNPVRGLDLGTFRQELAEQTYRNEEKYDTDSHAPQNGHIPTADSETTAAIPWSLAPERAAVHEKPLHEARS